MHSSSISDVTNSAIIFRYKKFAKLSVFLTIISQIGVVISNFAFDYIADELTEDQLDLFTYPFIFSMTLSPILAGYLLDKKFFRQVLFFAFLKIVIGQIFITIGCIPTEVNFTLIFIGRIIYSIGFSMVLPSLVRFVLMWLNPEHIPLGLSLLFVVTILSQTAGVLLYDINPTTENLLVAEVGSLGLTLVSLVIAAVIWYIDYVANIKDVKDYNLLIQPSEPQFSKLFKLSRLVWGAVISSALTFATIYVYTNDLMAMAVKYFFNIGEDLFPYYEIFLGVVSALSLPIMAKLIKVESQKFGLLVCEHLIAVAGFAVLAFSEELPGFIVGILTLGAVQASFYLTFFILLITMMKWEMLGMMIGIFFSIRNALIIGFDIPLDVMGKYFYGQGIEHKLIYRYQTLLLVGLTFVLGFFICLLAYLSNKKSRMFETEADLRKTFAGATHHHHESLLSDD